MAELKGRLWKAVFYPDSCPNWKDVIEDWGIPALVSPCHDRDFDAQTGELKKPHHHVLFEFDGPVTYSQAVSLVEELGIHYCKKCNSRRRDERYWCHLDSPTKAQYDPADCFFFGGYEVRFLEDAQTFDGIAAIHELAESLGIIYYADLSNEILQRAPELLTTLLRYPAHFNNFCYSRERMAGKLDNASYVKSRRKVGRVC